MPESPSPRPFAVLIDSWLYYATDLQDALDALKCRLEMPEYHNSGYGFLYQYFPKCGYRRVFMYMKDDAGKMIEGFKENKAEPWKLPRLNPDNPENPFLNHYGFVYFYTNLSGKQQRREFDTWSSCYEDAYSEARSYIEGRLKQYQPSHLRGYILRLLWVR